MSNSISIPAPYDEKLYRALRCGDIVEITGTIYTARDAAHARLVAALESGEELPIDVKDQVIYYAGPTPAKPGRPIGSCGPTTSGRMDSFTPALLNAGLKGMIGKGPRSEEVVEALVAHGAVYFASVGGAAAYTARCITEAKVIAYDDLGPEAIRKLTVVNYPCVVAIDSLGNNLFEQGPDRYRTSH